MLPNSASGKRCPWATMFAAKSRGVVERAVFDDAEVDPLESDHPATRRLLQQPRAEQIQKSLVRNQYICPGQRLEISFGPQGRRRCRTSSARSRTFRRMSCRRE